MHRHVVVVHSAGEGRVRLRLPSGQPVSGDLDEFEPDFLDHTDRRTEHDIDDAEHALTASRAQAQLVLAKQLHDMKRNIK